MKTKSGFERIGKKVVVANLKGLFNIKMERLRKETWCLRIFRVFVGYVLITSQKLTHLKRLSR
jgi:hypothetical protein